MSLKSKIEAVIYASEEPVTLAQLVGLLAQEAQAELDELASLQANLPLDIEGAESTARGILNAGSEWDGVDRVVEPNWDAGSSLLGGNVSAEAVPADPAEEADPYSTDVVTGSVTRQPTQEASNTTITPDGEAEKRRARERERQVRDYVRRAIDELMRDYAEADRGIEVREVAGGFRMGTKPEYHDAVRGFVRLLKPALKLSLQALETLAVVAYKQPVTAAEISEIRGVDSAGVLGGLIARKLLATAGRKQVIGRPMLYKTTREFLVRFGLKDVQELPSMEEFERMAGELNEQEDLPMESTEAVIERANAREDADHIRAENGAGELDSDREPEANTEAGTNPETGVPVQDSPPANESAQIALEPDTREEAKV